MVLALQGPLAEPVNLGCPTLVVDTEDGYEPWIDRIEREIRKFVRALGTRATTQPQRRESLEAGVNEAAATAWQSRLRHEQSGPLVPYPTAW